MTSLHETMPADQAERLHLLIEEAAEVQKAATKALRHGLDNYHPSDPNTSNAEQLAKECGHFNFAVDLCLRNGDMSLAGITQAMTHKIHTIWRWLRHNTWESNYNEREIPGEEE